MKIALRAIGVSLAVATAACGGCGGRQQEVAKGTVSAAGSFSIVDKPGPVRGPNSPLLGGMQGVLALPAPPCGTEEAKKAEMCVQWVVDPRLAPRRIELEPTPQPPPESKPK